MNILGIISSFLIILAISINLLMHKNIENNHTHKSLQGYMAANRKALNNCEKKLMPRIKKESTSKKKKPATKKKLKPIYNCGKLNLSIENTNYLTKLLHILYGDNLLEDELVQQKILRSILKQVKQKQPLEKLKFKSPTLQLIYYQMLQGIKSKNIYSLLDFVDTQMPPHKICLQHANKTILTMLFNAEVADKIIALRSEKKITASELETIFNEAYYTLPSDNNLKEIASFYHFSTKRQESQVTGYDKKSQICLKRRLRLDR